MKKLLTVWLALMAFMPSTALFAADSKWYQVELIVFKRADESALNQEQWQKITGQLLDGPVVHLQPVYGNNNHAFEALPPEKLTLIEQAKRISRNHDLSLLTHIAWYQPISHRAGNPVYFHSEQDYLGDKVTLFNEDSPDEHKPHLWSVEGLLNITLARYFHLTSDIIIRLPVSQPDEDGSMWSPSQTVLKSFQQATHTRMRSGELYYIDHPVFGMLARIAPIDTPAIVSTDHTDEGVSDLEE